jgi:hypothetical protein
VEEPLGFPSAGDFCDSPSRSVEIPESVEGQLELARYGANNAP